MEMISIWINILLNAGSLVLGLLAWILPLVNVLRYKRERKNWIPFFGASLSACAVSLWMQIISTNQRVNVRDFDGLEDFYYAVAISSTVLIVVTLLLNTAVLILYSKRDARE